MDYQKAYEEEKEKLKRTKRATELNKLLTTLYKTGFTLRSLQQAYEKHLKEYPAESKQLLANLAELDRQPPTEGTKTHREKVQQKLIKISNLAMQAQMDLPGLIKDIEANQADIDKCEKELHKVLPKEKDLPDGVPAAFVAPQEGRFSVHRYEFDINPT